MLIKSDVVKSSAFLFSEITVAAVFLICAILFPAVSYSLLVLFAIMTLAIYIYVEQRLSIIELRNELYEYRLKENEFMVRTEQLRRALHDIRSPMTAVRLRLQLLQRSEGGMDVKQITRMEESLDTAFEHIQHISDIQKGKVKPTDTLLISVKEMRSRTAKQAIVEKH